MRMNMGLLYKRNDRKLNVQHWIKNEFRVQMEGDFDMILHVWQTGKWALNPHMFIEDTKAISFEPTYVFAEHAL